MNALTQTWSLLALDRGLIPVVDNDAALAIGEMTSQFPHDLMMSCVALED